MYERFFGLADAPFRLTPDPRYLFLSQKYAEALAHLRLGLSESSGFVCITGDVGTGKTTLLRGFLAGLGPEYTTAYIFNPSLSALELLQTINAELGLPAASSSPKALIDELNSHVLAQREVGRASIVVVDEAQALAIDVLEQLRLLSNLETTTEKLLRIVLVGQPQLRGLLLHPELVQLNQRITLRWHMGPLERAEAFAYVRHRLWVAGAGKGTCVFTSPALWLLHRLSRGVPRLINMIAHRAMLAAFAADRHTVGINSVLSAYREIGAVPLTASAPAPASGRRAGWVFAALAVAIGLVALGVPRFGWLDPMGWIEDRAGRAATGDGGTPNGGTPPPAEGGAGKARSAAEPPVRVVRRPARAPARVMDTAPAPARVSVPAPKPEPVPVRVSAPAPKPEPAPVRVSAPAPKPEPAPARVSAPAPKPEPVPVRVSAPAPKPEPAAALVSVPAPKPEPANVPPEPASVPVVAREPVPARTDTAVPARADATKVARRIADLGEKRSARAAVAALLDSWQARPLASSEQAAPSGLADVAKRRGLEYLQLEGNQRLLRVLDLPAVLELRLPEASGPRFVALTRLDRDGPVLAVDGARITVDPVFLEQHWFGQAHLFWRDFEGLGLTFGRDASPVQVTRLQKLLARAGAYDGPVSGVYGDATAAAVLNFQRSRFLVADGMIGRLTRIVLYTAAGYKPPTLGAAAGAAS